ncbi:MAG: hypothetical protein VYD00_02780 [Pseudomonadota bacterium]|nr:hypothetical protein [Pseudomonadota bacterium]
MSRPDQAAIAALDEPVIRPVFFAWLDIQGDPVRANTSGRNITPSGTGDPDLDGYEFIGIGAGFVSITPVKYKAGGSDSVTAALSGIPGIDDETLDLLADKANWRGREARMWRVIRDANNIQRGGYHAYYTGKMTALNHSGSAEDQILRVTIESYLAVFSEASNRTYLDQELVDPDDLSARASIAIANGNYGGASTRSGGGGGSGGGFGGYMQSLVQR